jgi:uncharacterized delta-60 repeat protein
MRTNTFAVAVIAMLVLSSLVGTASADAGDLDTSFGSGGKVTTVWNDYSSAYGVAIQPDGRVVAAGYASDSQNGAGDFALARYKVDGSLDTSFGSGGKVLTNINNNYDRSDRALAVAILPDGKILASGITIGDDSAIQAALARYNTNGSLDTSFGTGGKATADFAGSQGISALAVQADGRIVLAGLTTLTGGFFSYDFTVIRFNANGSLDTTFGTGGHVITDFFGSADVAYAVAVQPDGLITVAGYAIPALGAQDFAIARYNPDGSLDTTFGNGGRVTTDCFYGTDMAGSIALVDGGKILLGGLAANPSEAFFVVARYNSNGSLDTTFGSGDGIATSSPVSGLNDAADGARMAIQADGKIVLSMAGEDEYNFVVGRFNPDGSVDAGFGSGGYVMTDYFGNKDNPNAIATYGNDQIIVAGDTSLVGASTGQFLLARYLGGGAATSADLSASMTASLTTDQAGNRYITYKIKAGSAGPDSAYYVTIRDRLPLETAFYSLTVPQGWVVYSKPAVGQNGTISNSKSLLGGSSGVITLIVKVHPSVTHTTISNSATITSSFTPDPNTANNTASAQTNVP